MMAHYTARLLACVATASAVGAALLAAAPSAADDRALVGERVRALTRESTWTAVARIPMRFATFHPQGMVRIGDTLYVSSVEITTPTRRYPSRATATIATPARVSDTCSRSISRPPGPARCSPRSPWARARCTTRAASISTARRCGCPSRSIGPNSRSVIYTVDPRTLKATVVLRVADHIGGVVRDTDAGALHGVSWGSRRFYRWPMRADGAIAAAAGETPRAAEHVALRRLPGLQVRRTRRDALRRRHAISVPRPAPRRSRSAASISSISATDGRCTRCRCRCGRPPAWR